MITFTIIVGMVFFLLGALSAGFYCAELAAGLYDEVRNSQRTINALQENINRIKAEKIGEFIARGTVTDRHV